MTKKVEDKPILKAMVAISAMAYRLGVKGIDDLPGCCWEYQIDERWWIAVNGQTRPVLCSKGIWVAPFHTYIEYNGWPAGILSPIDGAIAAGDGVNEETFIKACEEIEELKP